MVDPKLFGEQIEKLKGSFKASYFDKGRVKVIYKKIGPLVTELELPHLIEYLIAYCTSQTPNVDAFMKCLNRMREDQQKEKQRKQEKFQEIRSITFLYCKKCSIRFEFNGTTLEMGLPQMCSECKGDSK